MPAGTKKDCVATDKWVRPRRRSPPLSKRQHGTILRNFPSTDFRTASKTALCTLPPSHTAGIDPCATAPRTLLRYYLALRALTHEWREYPVYAPACTAAANALYMVSFTRKSRSARRHTSAAKAARVLTRRRVSMVLLRVFGRSGSIYAKVAKATLANCARRS